MSDHEEVAAKGDPEHLFDEIDEFDPFEDVDETNPDETYIKTITAEDCIRKMFMAGIDGSHEILEALIENASQGKDQITPIHIAANAEQEALIKQLTRPAATTDLSFLLNHDGQAVMSDKELAAKLEYLQKVLSPEIFVLLKEEHVRRLQLHPVIYYFLTILRVDVNKQDSRGYTALHYAAQVGNELAAAQLVITPGIDVDVSLEKFCNIKQMRDNENSTPLTLAASYCHFETARLLIHAGANLLVQDNNGRTPLHRAVMANCFEMVELITTSYESEHPRQGGLKLLINKTDDSNRTALHLAVSHGHLSIVNHLVAKGTNIHMKSDELNSLLHMAAKKDYPELVQYLIENKVPVGETNAREETALHCSAINNTSRVTELLLNAGADIEARDQNYRFVSAQFRPIKRRTPLMLAAMENSVHVLEILLARGSTIITSDKYLKTPLYLAVENSCNQSVELLFSHNSEDNNYQYKLANRVDLTGNTPLHVAAAFGRTRLIAVSQGFTISNVPVH
ncbi:hypothetical protein Ciccas_006503 [Cichlidogyrus casuarinus]|uniref:Uncharacterized protein n=1 Tax=Cichlidogyrus casuarinus TaxID=1844966 RepID=A0ABD2Q5J2_9PLAT